MSGHVAAPLSAIQDVLVSLAVENEREGASACLGYGLTLAKAANAHLTVHSASWRIAGDGTWRAGLADDIAASDDGLAAVAEATAARMFGEATFAGVLCAAESAHLTYPEIVSRLAAQARLHDLAVLDAGPHAFGSNQEMIEKALLMSGRPVIAVPPGCDTFATRRIVIAWDGRAQAVRAANGALPFLRAAEEVELVSVVGDNELSNSVPGAEFAPHLARHGIAVTVKILPAVGGDIAETLRQEAETFRADMIVMGAYRHAHAQESVFGSVTRSLLTRSSIPLFLTH